MLCGAAAAGPDVTVHREVGLLVARAGRETRKKVPLLKKSQCSRAAVTVIAVFTTSCLFTMLSELKSSYLMKKSQLQGKMKDWKGRIFCHLWVAGFMEV